jgi:Flp pilus assembly protein TadD
MMAQTPGAPGIARALARVRQQITREPNVAAFHSLVGTLLMSANDLAGAQDALTHAVALSPSDLGMKLLLAQVQQRRGNVEAAAETIAAAAAEHPRSPEPYSILGALEESRGNLDRAKADYQKALDVNADYAPAANNLAFLLLTTGGNVDVALTLAETAHRHLPKSPNTADTLGWAYYKKGAYVFAIRLLSEAVEAAPNNAAYEYHLGMAYLKQKDMANARKHLRRASNLTQNAQAASAAKGELERLGG